MRTRKSALVLAGLLAWAGPSLPARQKPSPLGARISALAAHIRKAAGKAGKALALARRAAREEDPRKADRALALAFPAYGKALALLEKGDPSAAVELARLADGAKDPYVKLHALYHLGRLLLDGDDPEGAADAFSRFFAGKSHLSPLEPEASFFYGISLSKIPSPEEAAEVLASFLKGFPRAPERYRAVAAQVLQELRAPQADPLEGIADLMKSVERNLKRGDPGEKTVRREKEILDKLDDLLKKMEPKKNSRKSPSSGGGADSKPSRPASNSKPHGSPKGLGSLHRGRAALAERWGKLPGKEREKVLQELRKRFPPRYSALLEAYFRKLSKKR